MTDRQDAVVSMYQEVDRLFESNAEKVSKDEILKKHAKEFHTNVVDIARYMQAQEFDSKGFALKKKQEKANLSDFIFKLTSAFCSFGVDTDNQPIVEEFNLSESHVNKMNDADFVNYANRLTTSLDEYIKELKPYHITADELVNLTKLTGDYSDLLHIPNEVIKGKSIATEKIKELITKCHKILDNSIDRDMIYYENTDESFYKEYKKRREIHDNNSKALSVKGKVYDADNTCDDAKTQCPLEHVKVIAKFKPGHAWKEMHTVTSEKGNFQFKGIPDGKCTLTFELVYYDTVSKSIAVFSKEATKVDIEMKKTQND